jgi:signal transduction histidine kinase
LAVDRSVDLVVRAPERVPAQVDPTRLQQVLLNLLSNAFKFTPADGTVRVELRVTEDGAAVVEVADSGPGIAPDERDEIFERFHQESGSTRRAGGTGLGLHIARELVALHGGTIGIGDAPEGGALFVVELPLAAPPGTPVREDEAVEEALIEGSDATLLDGYELEHDARNGSRRDTQGDLPLVLVVEDNPDMNRFICDALAGAYRIRATFDGRQGFEEARAVRPDLIVCDFMMPVMDGDALVRAVRAEPRIDTTPILVLTARNDSAARIGVLRHGANDYLLKPFYQPELRARVDNLVKVRLYEERLRSLEMAEERDRIARDLHDLVIQRVFAVGMRLTSMVPAVPDVTADRLRDVVGELDSVISDIRTTIFDLQTKVSGTGGVRSGVLQLTADAGERLGFQPRVEFEGPVDTLVDTRTGDELLAVLREALSNVIRHAGASTVDVDLSAAGPELVLRVADDGVGPGPGTSAGFGLHNMDARASSLGGTFRITARRPGTLVEWRVPLDGEAPARVPAD